MCWHRHSRLWGREARAPVISVTSVLGDGALRAICREVLVQSGQG